ncbi:MAG: S1/P1 nuclease [Dokdonella sp.]|uniref:S1/P1 nuclease n=1 Tax=Dokdonella sp. TaxID=2291710 RepID=UPI003266E7B9
MDRIPMLLFALLLLSPNVARAWGPAAHRMVAQLAQDQLAPATRVDVKRLLAVTHDHQLADVATWADDLRHLREERALWRSTAPSHFVNFASASCRYDAATECAGGRCIVAAIERNAHTLGDHSRTDAERAQALRFLVHYIGDVHQPLHAGYRKDKGGNAFQIRRKGRGTNLHAVWDSPVLASRHIGWQRQARLLAARPLPRASGGPRQWAEESCRVSRDAGIYPHSHRLDDAYLVRMRPLAEERVRNAASRLAMVLNRELGRKSHR